MTKMLAGRIAFSILLFVHSLMHFIGFIKVWGFPLSHYLTYGTKMESAATGSKTTAVFWMFTCFTMVVSLAVYLLQKPWWWLVVLVAILTSQILIIMYWREAKYGTLLNLIVLIAVILAYHNQKFNNLVRNDVRLLLTSQIAEPRTLITQQSLGILPPIVQRWLANSNVVGKEKIHTVHLTQKGRMKNKPGGRWMSMNAEQVITCHTPGFVWNAVIDAGYFLRLTGRDKYMDGKGNMLIKAQGLVTIADSGGDETDQGAMMRYLAEIIWLPTAALSNYIQWEHVNDTTARATMSFANKTVDGLFLFDHNGDITGFEGRRYANFDGHFSLETWAIRVIGHREFAGFRIADKCEVTWKLNRGDFTWLQLEVTDIIYNNVDRINNLKL